ncbi:hypothetical protein DQ04_13411010 [Trypanosoma grayi]|uniref:hypothetical protein n=1 Tax=Trypanosoma grayi TaxID=71804 RepID=UPI0004F490D9|nr:hypothetical protein DQ04_13411010 [Trypanosoma grayi]KEG06544.1 hypothetical protein DQ04_13411010 [Trypanosoma grayi]
MGKVPERRDCRKITRHQIISFTVEYPVSRTGEFNAIRYSSPGNCAMVGIQRDLLSGDQAEGLTGDRSLGYRASVVAHARGLKDLYDQEVLVGMGGFPHHRVPHNLP